MTDTQRRAEEIYLDSATIDNDFRPLSDEKISKQLGAEGMKAGSSTVNRWKKSLHWEDKLQTKISAVGGVKDANVAKGSALEVSVKKTLVTVEKNAELIGGSFELLQHWINKLQQRMHDGGPITLDEIKTVAKIYELSSLREDKMLDRLANAGTEGGITPEEALDRLENAMINFTFEGDDDIVETEFEIT